eukprot:TRINITY_DN12122_c0_g1_i1.p1 TRINITY_DN12122_c0_g1~~TRINITY_DN12122_c0_g1_i1.p1  ORF type:complete len:178 (-),score=21.14 TRINITY_DN12122_c0_g1_i1:43-576(-)
MVDSIISAKGFCFDIEWGVVHEIISIMVGIADKNAEVKKEIARLLQIIFTSIKNYYTQRKYHGPVEDLMNSYMQVKEMIVDQYFDSLYLGLISRMPIEPFAEKLQQFLEFESNILPDARIKSLLLSLRALYISLNNREKQQIFESMIIAKNQTWNFSKDNTLSVSYTHLTLPTICSV